MPVPSASRSATPVLPRDNTIGNNEIADREEFPRHCTGGHLVLIAQGHRTTVSSFAKSIAGEKVVIEPFAWCNDLFHGEIFCITAQFEPGDNALT